MAKATIELVCPKCGKRFEITKTCFNRRDADEWESWAAGAHAGDLCRDCYREAKRKEEIEKSRAAGLPDLVGSEKQVAWATEIRLGMWEKFQRLKGSCFAQAAVLTTNVFQRVTSATAYIDQRNGEWYDFATSQFTKAEKAEMESLKEEG